MTHETTKTNQTEIATVSVQNWTLHRASPDTEPMILDVELATRLGYAKPFLIRKLIQRMADAGQLGILHHMEIIHPGAGRPGRQYFLTEKQTLQIVARSRTKTAHRVLSEILDVYFAYRHGELEALRRSFAISPAQLSTRVAPQEPPLASRVKEFLERWYQEDPDRALSVSALQAAYNNMNWRSKPVMLADFAELLRHLLPGKLRWVGSTLFAVGIVRRGGGV